MSVTSRRLLWFRIAAVLLGLSVLPVAEGICHLLDVGQPDDVNDPFVGFSDLHPLFVKNPENSTYEIARSRREFFKPDSFVADKPDNTYRVFFLGGSTVQGRPWSIETSFATCFELLLKQFAPTRNWEVVNCGGISYASYRLVPILQECLTHQPDMIVVCTGHNEFLEDRQYGEFKTENGLQRALRLTSRLRSLSLIRSSMMGTPKRDGALPTLKAEVDAMLDYRNGLAAYHRDAKWQSDVVRHFEYNLRRIVRLASDANVPLILMRPCSNLSDSPPFKSEHRTDLTETERAEFDRHVKLARSAVRDNLANAIKRYEAATLIDDQYALTLFELGKCYESAGRFSEARRLFIAAKEQDVCPLRMIQPLADAMQNVVDEKGVQFFDIDELMTAYSNNGITDSKFLVDHIHPSFRGNQLIAERMLEVLAAGLAVALPGDWKEQAQVRFKLHLASLEDLYYLKGQRSLEALRMWTQGKADGPALPTLQ